MKTSKNSKIHAKSTKPILIWIDWYQKKFIPNPSKSRNPKIGEIENHKRANLEFGAAVPAPKTTCVAVGWSFGAKRRGGIWFGVCLRLSCSLIEDWRFVWAVIVCIRMYWLFIKKLTWHYIIGSVKELVYSSFVQNVF